jgi:hypothetical protein
MDETDVRSCFGDGLEAKCDQRAEMAAEIGKWDAKSRKISRINGSF